MQRRARVVVGFLVWCALITLAAWGRGRVDGEEIVLRRSLDQLFREPPRIQARFPAGSPIEAGGPLRFEDEGGELVSAGRVVDLREVEGERLATIEVWPEFHPLFGEDTRLVACRTSGSVGWIVSTLLPPERLERIRERLESRWRLERDVLMRDLEPGLRTLAESATDIVREDLRSVLDSHRAEFAVIGDVLRERAWEKNVQQVFVEDVWPIVESRSRPILAGIGDEILEQIPVWSLSWSIVVQKLPFSDEDRVAARMREFLSEKALPIVRKHGQDFRHMSAEILRDAFKNERVVEAFGAAFADVAQDPRFRAASWTVLRALLIDNPRLRDLLASAAQRPDLRGPLDRFLAAAEPDVKAVANMILLADDGRSINPDLARVLRRRLLRENEHWVLIEGRGRPIDWPPAGPLVGIDGGIR